MASPSEVTLRDTCADSEVQRNSGLPNNSGSTREVTDSPQNSPRRKSQGPSREGGKAQSPRRKIDRKTPWRSRMMNSLRRKPKRSAQSSAEILEATDFSFRQPAPRGSPAIPSASNKKHDSPSIDLRRLKRPTHSSLEVSKYFAKPSHASYSCGQRGRTQTKIVLFTQCM